ncbi:hypothetical protein chiPu_0001575 [Chiloscyllium punctatum]|uniref:Uncharacterized protein n=1 Tax=Chiloscyllium punctatum TaxID=137246 RepID=A0A401RYG0_CHIPU|nr:hypothetical protein [Chiloscyllium punctatum]
MECQAAPEEENQALQHCWAMYREKGGGEAGLGFSVFTRRFTASFIEFTAKDITKARQAVVDIGNSQLQLYINEDDAMDLLEFHAEELINEDLMEQEQQMIAFEEEGWDLEIPEPKKVLTKDLAKAFCLIEARMAKLEKQDPNVERFTKFTR